MTAATAPTKRPAPKKKAPAKTPATKKSDGPVAKVWAICDRMPKAERKEVLAACEKAGINPATAATQYYRWTHRNDKK